MSNQSTPNALVCSSQPGGHTILDEYPKPKTRKISALCERIGGVYHAATADVNFVFDVDGNEKFVPAHKSILAFHSPVFRQMFYGENRERFKESGDIKLTDTTIDAFVEFMECIYIVLYFHELSEAEMSHLVYLAHKYDVDWLEERCEEILDEIIVEDIQSILWVIPLATLYSYDKLREKCIGRILKNGNLLVDLPEFIGCEREVVKEILGVDFINRNEAKVFVACINWAKRACEKAELNPETLENIRAQLGDCFELIRFDSMTAEQFLQCLNINSSVFTSWFTHCQNQQITSKLTENIPNKKQCKSDHMKRCWVVVIGSPFIDKVSSLQRFLDDTTTVDVTFVLKNEKNEEIERLSAHKCILAKGSPVFANQFKNTNNSNEEINIPDTSADAFKGFLRLLYAHTFNQFNHFAKDIAEQHTDAILSMAKTYEAKHIIDLYRDHLVRTLNVQNVILRFELSRKHSLDSLKSRCLDFMKKNGAQTIRSDAFLDCSQLIFKAILELGIPNDGNSLIDACIKWAKNYCQKHQLDPEDRKDLRDVFGNAFEWIPFSSMDPAEFIDFQGDYGDMFTADELKKLINRLAKRRKDENAESTGSN